MVSVVPSIIPILTANAVAANQPKKQKNPDGSGEKKLKDSPLNDKINCRVYLNNGKTIDGHFNGFWYEDNSDEEGIWIKTDNGILTINSDEYDRVQYYHKKPVKESSFNEEINSILKNAGCSLVESQNYFTDWNSIKDKVVKMVIRGRLEESGYLENDEWFIQQWLEENASPEMLEQLYEECGTDDLYWVAIYINKNADEGGVISKVAYEVIGQYYDTITEQLQKEFEDNNLIYRMIDSDKSPKEIAQILKTNGTGNCWAKQEENAKAYYGNGNYNEYCLIGEATIDNVNWETTIYLRMMAEYENEVRLKKDTPIHIVGIKYYHYNEDNKLDKQDHMKVDLNLNVGHKYVFTESKQVNESIAFVSEKDLSDIILKNPTKRELRENNLTLCRCMEDSEGNWYFADMENMLHAYIVYELRDEASFPLFDGNDCYGIAYYDAESNEFWYNLNDYMYKKECIEQYNNSEYLRTTFPNARVIPNPWNNQVDDELDDDDEELDELDESVAYTGALIGDTILKNPTRKELREWDLMNCRVVLDWNTNDFYFADAYINIHDDIIGKVNAGENDSLYYDCYDNTFYKRDEYRNENEKMYMERSLSQWLSSFEYIKNTFGNFNAKISMEEEPFESFKPQGNQLTEEIIHAEKSNYDDYMAVVLKNPTRRELRDNGLDRSRFICFKDGTWLFFDSMQWVHENILDDYAPKLGNGVSGGFYDNRSNTFIFVESYDSNEYTEEFDEETKYYEEKSKDWLLNNQYILNTFGANLKVEIIGDWVDSPW